MKTPRWLTILFTICLLLHFGQPVSGQPTAAPLQAPVLGPWLNIWMGVDDIPNVEPAVAYNSIHDEYLVVWVDEVDDTTWTIRARRVGGQGQQLGSFEVGSFTEHLCFAPVVAYGPLQDRYMVVYTYKYSPSDRDIYARMVAGDGSGPVGDTRQVVSTVEDQSGAAIAYNSQADEFLVGYTEQPGTVQAKVYLQRRNSKDGMALSAHLMLPDNSDGLARSYAALAYNARSNRYLTAYQVGAGPTGNGVRSSLVSADLTTIQPEYHIWDPPAGLDAYNPRVAAGPDEYLVAWTVADYTPSPPSVALTDGYARRVDAAGMPGGVAFPLTAGAYPFDLRHPSDLAYATGYGYLAGLHRGQSTASLQDTYARFALPGGQTVSNEFPIDASTDRAWDASIACSLGPTCLVAEVHQHTGPDAVSDIRGRLVHVQRAYLPVTLRQSRRLQVDAP